MPSKTHQDTAIDLSDYFFDCESLLSQKRNRNEEDHQNREMKEKKKYEIRFKHKPKKADELPKNSQNDRCEMNNSSSDTCSL